MDNTNNKTAVDNQVVISNKSSPFGLAQKEQQPPINPEVKSQIEAILEASEKEPAIRPEVREAGVKEVSDKPFLTNEHELAGIRHAGESTPVLTQPSGKIELPFASQGEIKKTIRTYSWTNSIRSLAESCKKTLKRLGLWEEK